MLVVTCVWVGDKYGSEYVTRLKNMVARHLPIAHKFVCYTDHLAAHDILGPDILSVQIGGLNLEGWWNKIVVFANLKDEHRLYFDLDTVIVDDLTPLAEWDGVFGICENFTKLNMAPYRTWPCNYGSCIMSLAPGFGWLIADKFFENPNSWIEQCNHGDQQAIEKIFPHAEFLQNVMPPGYFVGYRELTNQKPEGASVVVFAGAHKPDNCPHQWIRDEWR